MGRGVEGGRQCGGGSGGGGGDEGGEGKRTGGIDGQVCGCHPVVVSFVHQGEECGGKGVSGGEEGGEESGTVGIVGRRSYPFWPSQEESAEGANGVAFADEVEDVVSVGSVEGRKVEGRWRVGLCLMGGWSG